jgi:hypothetical protein
VCYGGVPPLAVGVHKTELVIVGSGMRSSVVDLVLLDRLPGDAQPPFPLVWALRWVAGVQQELPAQRAASTLRGQQAQGVGVQRRRGCLRCRSAQYRARAGSSGDDVPATMRCRTILVHTNRTR